MKVKEIQRTANIAWSPATQHPTYIAAGTAAQQLDATFSTNAALELFTLNLADSGRQMNLAGSLATECRFHKLAWSSHDMSSSSESSGVLCGGADNGLIYMWNPSKILSGEEPLVYKSEKHTGAVAALDFNPYQTNLLASGASDSEIYIWDLNNPTNPMTPGAKSLPPDEVSCISWNRQVQHIVASVFPARCVIWDLRKNEPIIKVSDSMSRIKTKLVAWHPETATQLCLASEDDHTPVIQLWDLRSATSPLKVLENHQRGILSMAWCPQDPDLLLSCGKDNRILCWNPNSDVQGGEVVYELPTSSQWSYDVQWCPRNPAIISNCAFDGNISIYSLMGGEQSDSNTSASNKIADSFPADPFSQAQAQFQQHAQKAAVVPLKKPPKWLRRPCGASFAFGGKLISFGNEQPQHPQQPVSRHVSISQVVTEQEILTRSNELETALANNQFTEFCNLKIANCSDAHEESIWNFLKINFEKDPRRHFLDLLGYDQSKLSEKVHEKTNVPQVNGVASGIDAGELAQRMATLGNDVNEKQLFGKQASPRVSGAQTPGSLSGETNEAVAAFDQIASHKGESRSESPFPISTSTDDVDGIINQAVLIGNFEVAVEMCLYDERWAEAIILAIAGGPDLLARTQQKYFNKNRDTSSRLISSVVTGNWSHVIQTCDLDNWKEALAVALTYAQADDFVQLCDMLGTRLEIERHGELALNAALCYICSGNVEKLVACWARLNDGNSSSDALQNLVEKVMMLRKSVELSYGYAPEIKKGHLPEHLSRYAGLLAAQGSLNTAMNYLGDTKEQSLLVLRDRLYNALGNNASAMPKPPAAFQKVNVLGHPAPVQQQAQQQPTQRQARYPASSGGFTGYGQQTQAANTFQTTTSTSHPNYKPTPQYTGYNNAPVPTQTYSQPQPSPMTSMNHTGGTPATAYQRGGLSQKYPSSQANYVNTYSQPNYISPDMSSQQNPYSSGAIFPGNVSQAPPTSMYNPAQNISGGASQQAIQPTGPSQSSYLESRPETAWNDPPTIKQSRKKQTHYDAPAPITTPIFNPDAPAVPDYGAPGAPMTYGVPPQTQQGSMYDPGHHAQVTKMPPQQLPQQPAQQRRPEPPAPVQKGPIPAEHLVLQNMFDDLAKRCLAVANNPHQKRKLEDVCRKLEALYDKLRETALSGNVTLGLHQIIQAVQQFDYQTGLAIHTQMITQGNFSEISSFMPGIKVLLQTALQLNVYIQ